MKAIIFDFGRTIYDRDNERVFPELLELLPELSQRYKLAIVSLATAGDIEERFEILEKNNIRTYFDPILIVRADKDSAYNMTLRRLDMRPENVIVVDDRTRRGITWGNALGATTIWFKNGKFAGELPDETTGEPTHTITSLSELRNILLKK